MYTPLLLFPRLARGAGATLLLFLLSFLLVHLFKLALLGAKTRRTTNRAPNEATPPPKNEPQKPQRPVYYLVERKRARPKGKYDEPKEIRFQ